jgi:histidyl-tRNA synthetase
VKLLINNRKLLEGFYRALGIEKIHEVLRLVDKLDKLGEEKVVCCLVDDVGIAPDVAEKCVRLGKIRGSRAEEIQASVSAFGLSHPLLTEGLNELCSVLDVFGESGEDGIVADISIARGFDYYTGIVCEGKFIDFPKYPTIAAGGRYDNLVSDKSLRLPGVGMSLGITRILGLVLHEGLVRSSRKTPACVLVALVSEERRRASFAVADGLRKRGISCEVYSRPDKYGKQIAYASAKGIPHVWFPDESGNGPGEVRILSIREQFPADLNSWEPGPENLKVDIIKDDAAFQSLLKNPKLR